MQRDREAQKRQSDRTDKQKEMAVEERGIQQVLGDNIQGPNIEEDEEEDGKFGKLPCEWITVNPEVLSPNIRMLIETCIGPEVGQPMFTNLRMQKECPGFETSPFSNKVKFLPVWAVKRIWATTHKAL